MATWWLDELAHAGHEHLDAQYVAGYEAKAGYDPADDLETLRRHGFGATSTIVDLGAGTGRFSAVPIVASNGRTVRPVTAKRRRIRSQRETRAVLRNSCRQWRELWALLANA